MSSLGPNISLSVGGGTIQDAVAERLYLLESTLLTDYTPVPEPQPVFLDFLSTAAHPTSNPVNLPRPFYIPPVPPPSVGVGNDNFNATGGFSWAGLMFGFDAGEVLLPPFDFKLGSMDYVTTAIDPDRPSELWDGRLINPGSVQRAVSLTSVGSAAVETTAGEIVIANADGALDSILDTYFAVSQAVQIKIGQRDYLWRQMITLWEVRITGVGITQEEMTLEVADPTAYTDVNYPTSFYNGDGAAGGDPDLDGAQKPIVLGFVRNYQPQIINRAALIYQIHGGPIISVDAVADKGVPLTFNADYATYALLQGATVPAGEYATCLEEGLVRLGDDPAGVITVDTVGDRNGGDDIRSLATFLASKIEVELQIDVNLPSFAALPEWRAGWVQKGRFTYQAALSRFVGDSGYLWGSLTTGPLSTGQLLPPDDADVSAVIFEPEDILELERISLPAGYESTHKRRIVRYAKNWQVQSDTDLAGTATEAAFRNTEWRQSFATAVVATRNALDPDVLDTSLADSADALALAEYLISLHGVRRRMFDVQSKIFGTLPALGSNVKLFYPRFGLDAGRTFRVVSVDQNFEDSTVNYLLWG